MGLVEVKEVLAPEEMSMSYRNLLWSAVYVEYNNDYQDASVDDLSVGIWVHGFGKAYDDIERLKRRDVLAQVKRWIQTADWMKVYDMLETIISAGGDSSDFISSLNGAMESHKVPFRIVNGLVTPVDAPTDVEAVEDALEKLRGLPAAQGHIQRALALMSDRVNPDYTNSVKESISAVESLCMVLVSKPNASLGDALKVLGGMDGISLHPALIKSWTAAFGWSSTAKGIRHGASNAEKVNEAEARYWLVTSSAFVALLVKEALAAGISIAPQQSEIVENR